MNKCWTFLLLGGLGIGVTPAEIIIAQNADWPYTAPIIVRNFSVKEEQFEVFGAVAVPGRFSLGAGESRRVLLTFEKPSGPTEGVVKVLSMRNSVEGFGTGTGVKIPFHIRAADNTKFLASSREASAEFSYVFGAGIVLATLFLLWQVAGIIQQWIFNSSRQ